MFGDSLHRDRLAEARGMNRISQHSELLMTVRVIADPASDASERLPANATAPDVRIAELRKSIGELTFLLRCEEQRLASLN